MALDHAVIPSLRRVRAALRLQQSDPVPYWHFGVDRLREACALLAGDVDELVARACNNGTKSLTLAAYAVACLQKRTHLDGVPLPQWKGPVTARYFSLDYVQQKASVQQAVLQMVGDSPHKARYKGDGVLGSLKIKPLDGDDDESRWSSLEFLSQENTRSGIGGRSDLDLFDEPPRRSILEEARKAGHARRRNKRLIGFTPTIRSQWHPLREMYGDSPRSQITRIGPDWAEVRWSLHEVKDFVLSPEKKERLLIAYGRDRPKASRDLLYDARVYGDYCDTEGAHPFDGTVLTALLGLCREPEIREFACIREIDGDNGRVRIETRTPVEVWAEPRPERRYYIPIDNSLGIDDPRYDPGELHVVEVGSGDLVARFSGPGGGFALGTLGAVLARYYNNATVDPETTGGWGEVVLSGLAEMGYGNIAKSRRELRPGEWHTELGFKTTTTSRPAMIGAVQRWLEDWRNGLRYAACPSRDCIEQLLDVILDPNGKAVAPANARHHAEAMILRGQSLRRAVRLAKPAPPEQKPLSSVDRLARIIAGGEVPAGHVAEPRRMPRM